MRIIFATGNAGKMREIREIMADMDMEICSMKEAGISLDIEENGTTFGGECADQGEGSSCLYEGYCAGR